MIRAAATDDTNIIFGATIDDRLNGQVWVTVVATGFGGRGRRPRGDFGTPPAEQRRPSGRGERRSRRAVLPEELTQGRRPVDAVPRHRVEARRARVRRLADPCRGARSGSSTPAGSRAARGTGSGGSSSVVSGAEQERLAEAVYAPENVALGRARRRDRRRGGSVRHRPLRAEHDARRLGRRRRLVPERDPGCRRRGRDLRRRGAGDRLLRLPGAAARPGEPQRGGVVGAREPQASVRARPRGRLAATGPAARRRVRERVEQAARVDVERDPHRRRRRAVAGGRSPPGARLRQPVDACQYGDQRTATRYVPPARDAEAEARLPEREHCGPSRPRDDRLRLRHGVDRRRRGARRPGSVPSRRSGRASPRVVSCGPAAHR